MTKSKRARIEISNYGDLENLSKNIADVKIKTRPTKKLISEILNRCDLKCIFISNSLHNLANKKVWNALEEMKIKIIIQKTGLGRKHKYEKNTMKKATDAAKKIGIRAASKKFKIPKSTIFNWLKKKI